MKKKEIYRTLDIISFVTWGVSIVIGASTGGSYGSVGGGALYGFFCGLGFRALIMLMNRTIDNPRRLLIFTVLVPISFLVGLIWGWDGARIGAGIGGIIAFCLVIGIVKGYDPY